jgi:SAM-dependent methyltransferase
VVILAAMASCFLTCACRFPKCGFSAEKTYVDESSMKMKIKEFFNKYLHSIAQVHEKNFLCPICGYHGPFKDYIYGSCVIQHNNCPECLSASRHRLQYLVFKQLSEHYSFSNKTLLHCAPEACLQTFLKGIYGSYYASNIIGQDVDCIADLRCLPFKAQSCDVIFASHVMEHIHDDYSVLQEMWRILRPGGMAVLPVPVFGPVTIEYVERNPLEYDHVRAPGLDYFTRYKEIFSEVQVFSSKDFPIRYQTFVYEDRENWPDTMPLRPKTKGKKHADFVPVCIKR